jgi:predicted Zn-dependent protease with MMP-like domain
MTRFEFEKLVSGAVATLPRHIRDAMDNVAFVIEQEARPAYRDIKGCF